MRSTFGPFALNEVKAADSNWVKLLVDCGSTSAQLFMDSFRHVLLFLLPCVYIPCLMCPTHPTPLCAPHPYVPHPHMCPAPTLCAPPLQVEIQRVLSLGVAAERIIYANPCKQVSYLKYACSNNVALMTFDNAHELPKVWDHFPAAQGLGPLPCCPRSWTTSLLHSWY